jgi:O-antigen/teichoic acid export membrane protein
MHIYLVGMMMNVFAVGHILPALDKGRFAAGNNACCLVISIVCSVIGASQWGLIGAAFGSVFTFAISELWSLKVVARTLGIGVHELMPWRAITQSLLGTWIGVGGVKLLAEMMHGTTLSILALKGLAFLIFFTGIFLALGGKKQLRLLLGHRSGPSNRRTDRNILWKNDETAVTPSGPASTKGSNDAKRISPRQQ